MADVTYYVAMPFLQDDAGSPVAGAAEECQSSSAALRRAEILSRTAGQHRRDRLQPHRRPVDRRIQRRAIAAKVRPGAGRPQRAVRPRRCGRSSVVPGSCSGLMPPLRLAHIHRAVGFFQRAWPASVWGPRMATPAEAPAFDGAATKHEAEPIDRLFQRRRLGVSVGLAEIPQQQCELVAAEPPDHVGGADVAQQRRHDGLQHLIAGGMAEGVVDRLQAIDVEQDQRAAGVIALDIGDRAIELALKAAPVGNLQQEVGIGGGLQLVRFAPAPAPIGPAAAGSPALASLDRRIGATGAATARGAGAVGRRFARAARALPPARPLLRRFAVRAAGSPWFSSSSATCARRLAGFTKTG